MKLRAYLKIALLAAPFILLAESTQDSRSLEELHNAARQGDVSAQYTLGDSYYYGKEVQKDFSAAIKWFRGAAEQGYLPAQYSLGNCYRYGNGIPHDYEKAVKWYRLAAEQGYKAAQYSLGKCYYYARGTPKDYEQAVKWHRLAAEQGYPYAQYSLGECYYDGDGVPHDYEKAVEWYRLAAEQGYATAQYILGKCYYYGDGVPQDYEKAVEWFRLAAEQKYARAQDFLGDCYYYAEGTSKDYKEAAKWYRLAAEQKNSSSQYSLGKCYYYGNGVPQDYEKAVEWFLLAAKQNYDMAQDFIGFCYYYGDGVPLDYTEAVKWYRLAADQKNETAQYSLGECYYYGNGVPQDYEKAREWYRLAANQGHKEAEAALKQVAGRERNHFGTSSPLATMRLPAIDIISQASGQHVFIPQPFPYRRNASDLSLFDFYAKYVESVYKSLAPHGFIVESLKKPNLYNSPKNNYASALEHLLTSLTASHSGSDKDFFITKLDGAKIKIDKVLSSDPNAVFYRKAQETIRVPLSELTPESRQIARAKITDYIFDRKLKISVDDNKGIPQEEWEEANPSEHTKQWFLDAGAPGVGFLKAAGEIKKHRAYQFNVLISNKSDIPMDNLIVEYQIFFKQEIAGAHENANEDYRFVGYATIGSISARDDYELIIAPPYLTDSILRSSSEDDEDYEYSYYLSYPKDHHQKSSGRMRGIWVRVHRVTQYGHLMNEYKKNLYPRKTKWDETRLLQ